MLTEINDDLNLDRIAESGQCFRWKKIDEGKYLIPAFKKCVVASETKKGLELDCTEEDYKKIWEDYFDLKVSYKKIRGMIDPEDRFLTASAEAGKGIRILRQDPFETLISFIISQRKNIPAIQSSVEKICRVFGKEIGEHDGKPVFSFPDAKELLNMTCKKNGTEAGDRCSFGQAGIDSCGLGYRLPYIQKTTRQIAANPGEFERLGKLPDRELLESLLSFTGVGIKVASCTMLFAYHRTDSFPVDVWIKRALDEHYPKGFPMDRYKPYNGIMQQYIFAYYRLFKD